MRDQPNKQPKSLLIVGNTCNYGAWMIKKLTEHSNGKTTFELLVENTGIERDALPWEGDSAFTGFNTISVSSFRPRPYPIFDRIFGESTRLNEYLAKFDRVHCFGLMAAWRVSLSRVDYTYQSYGDLLSTPFFDFRHPIASATRISGVRAALRNANTVVISQYADIPALKHLGYRGSVLEIPILHDSNKYQNGASMIKNNNHPSKDTYTFYFPSRHVAIKRLDKAITAVGSFRYKNPNVNLRLIFTNWGDLVESNRAHLARVGLSDISTWIPVQKRPELLALLSGDNVVVFDEFEDESIPMSIGGISRDAISCGARLITRFSENIVSNLYDSPPPIFICDHTVSSIERCINQAVESRGGNYERYKREVVAWYNRNFSQGNIRKYMKLFGIE